MSNSILKIGTKIQIDRNLYKIINGEILIFKENKK